MPCKITMQYTFTVRVIAKKCPFLHMFIKDVSKLENEVKTALKCYCVFSNKITQFKLLRPKKLDLSREGQMECNIHSLFIKLGASILPNFVLPV